MAFSIFATDNFRIESGESANSKRRIDAGNVVESLVRKLKIQEMSTWKALFHFFPTIVTDGSGIPLSSRLMIIITLSIFLFVTVIDGSALLVFWECRYRPPPLCRSSADLRSSGNPVWE